MSFVTRCSASFFTIDIQTIVIEIKSTCVVYRRKRTNCSAVNSRRAKTFVSWLRKHLKSRMKLAVSRKAFVSMDQKCITRSVKHQRTTCADNVSYINVIFSCSNRCSTIMYRNGCIINPYLKNCELYSPATRSEYNPRTIFTLA